VTSVARRLGATLLGAVLTLALGVAAPSTGADEATAEEAPLSELEREWGIRLLGIRRVAGGYGLDFRYQVLDPVKAAPILQRKQSRDPHLVVEKSGATLRVPFSHKVGTMRQSVRVESQIKKGNRYFVLFANPSRHVEPGDQVTIVIGGFRAEHVTVM
jgi:hypothetical protein